MYHTVIVEGLRKIREENLKLTKESLDLEKWNRQLGEGRSSERGRNEDEITRNTAKIMYGEYLEKKFEEMRDFICKKIFDAYPEEALKNVKEFIKQGE